MAGKNDEMIMCSFTAPRALKAKLDRRARKDGKSRSALIRDLLDAGLDRRVDPGAELRRVRQEVERLSGLVETTLAKRRKR